MKEIEECTIQKVWKTTMRPKKENPVPVTVIEEPPTILTQVVKFTLGGVWCIKLQASKVLRTFLPKVRSETKVKQRTITSLTKWWDQEPKK